MIGSFWNLCRACPSMPVDKLHSEYRSTYRWHEYRGGSGAQAATQGGPAPLSQPQQQQPQPQQQSQLPQPQPQSMGGEQHQAAQPPQPPQPGVVVRRAPLPSQSNPPRAPSIEPAMPRRKKYPGVAYKTNEIFEAAAAGLPSGTAHNAPAWNFGGVHTLDRARSMERTKYLAANRGERRSKSEGPRNARGERRHWIDTVEEKATSPSIAEKKMVSSEYRNQFAWPRDDAVDGAEGQPRKSVSMGALKAAQQKKRGEAAELEPLMNHDDDNKREESHKDTTTHRKITFRNAIAPFVRDPPDPTTKVATTTTTKGYKSEYKKKFRPFSYYVYEASKGTFTKCRELSKSRAQRGANRVAVSGDADPAAERMLPASNANNIVDNVVEDNKNKIEQSKPLANGPQSLGDKAADSWYREVLDLRKRAGEYKYRGWGTELAPEHITEIYNKQMELWHQVARRSSLSALSLATTNHRAISKEEKENENKSKTSPKKPKSFKSATPKIPDTPSQKSQRKKLQGHSFDNSSMSEGARGSSVEPTTGDHGPRSLEYRSPKRRPRSADPKPHQPAVPNGPLEDKRRPSKPSGLPLNSCNKYVGPSGEAKDVVNKSSPSALTSSPKRRPIKPKVGITIDEDVVPIRSGSAFRDHRLLDDSPVVKSPPEPTRVKSPEQMNMRSPDPVNWTVPLDTGKTFTVTQNVKSDDRRPASEMKGVSIMDDQHSTSISAPLDIDDGVVVGHALPKPIPQEQLPSVHHRPTKTEPPKTMDLSPTSGRAGGPKQLKTPTSPPNLTPIDETKVLDTVVTNGSLPQQRQQEQWPKVADEAPAFEMLMTATASATETAGAGGGGSNAFKPTEATQKSHGGVDTSIVAEAQSSTNAAAEVLERARSRFDQFWGKKEGNDSV